MGEGGQRYRLPEVSEDCNLGFFPHFHWFFNAILLYYKSHVANRFSQNAFVEFWQTLVICHQPMVVIESQFDLTRLRINAYYLSSQRVACYWWKWVVLIGTFSFPFKTKVKQQRHVRTCLSITWVKSLLNLTVVKYWKDMPSLHFLVLFDTKYTNIYNVELQTWYTFNSVNILSITEV